MVFDVLDITNESYSLVVSDVANSEMLHTLAARYGLARVRSPAHRVALLPLGQLQPFVQLLFKIAIAYLIEDVGVARFVDREGFVALGADDFVHRN